MIENDVTNILYIVEGQCTNSRRDETEVKRIHANETQQILVLRQQEYARGEPATKVVMVQAQR